MGPESRLFGKSIVLVVISGVSAEPATSVVRAKMEPQE